METQSVWLGAMRRPIQLATLVSLAITVLLCAYLMMDSTITMNSMVRPEGNALVIGTLLAIGLSVLLASIYMSDTPGSIQLQRTGPLHTAALALSPFALIPPLLLGCVQLSQLCSRILS